MSEFEDPAELDVLLPEVRDFNRLMDVRQAAMLTVNAFKVPKNATEADFAAIAEQQELLKAEYPERKTMADKFALFLDERFTYLNSLDVAETSQPGSHRELQRVKEEYHDLLDSLIANGEVDGELPRSKSSRKIMFLDFEYNPKFARVNRARTLFEFQDSQGRPMCLAKLMIFLMPRSYAANGVLTDQQRLLDIEKRIDTHDSSIIPVRTIYYGKRDN